MTKMQAKERITLGTTDPSYYACARNFAFLPFEKYQFTRTRDFFGVLRHRVLRNTTSTLLKHLYYDFGLNSCTMFHFFNGVSLGPTPWVVTFETLLPRWEGTTKLWIDYGVKKLAGESCKRLIAMSRCAYNIQSRYLDRFPEYKEAIVSKMLILHPSQSLTVHDYSEKILDSDRIEFTIVGHYFFLKGGKEILRVFDRLLQKSHPIRLNIVSRLWIADHASQATRIDAEEVFKIIAKYPANIIYYEWLPNSEVLRLLRRTHVALFPSYADTYGYFVLEAQSAGCPVISTDVRALPEINDNEIGWMIEVPKDEWGNGDVWSKDARQKFSVIIQEGLMAAIESLISDPSSIREKGVRCVNRIALNNDPHVRASQLEAVYDAILQ